MPLWLHFAVLVVQQLLYWQCVCYADAVVGWDYADDDDDADEDDGGAGGVARSCLCCCC